ncbi:hypothetical protein VTK73DRAFT_6875 [Phialemonium thermophilum]|uniref:GPI inositol-deacylase n=1 Tax=Phialemonium thermophilum TaxID=223376 RepID=A0ABR3WHY1_9PEZI
MVGLLLQCPSGFPPPPVLPFLKKRVFANGPGGQWKRFRSGKSTSSGDLPADEAHPKARPTLALPTGSSGPAPHPIHGESSLPIRSAGASSVSRRASAISDIHGQLFSSQQSLEHQRKRSQDRREDPLGLVVLHAPRERSVDILFIHGLGGTSLRTWCRNRDLENLWPQLWLPNELPTARILTFGYNAHFSSKKEQASLTIGDFATDLLFRMKYGESGLERLGQVPVIVVTHSLGGLVFKKAFIQGHLNDEFRDIVSKIRAVLFLATPHRGTDLAETLNRVLTTSVFGHSAKEYVTEMARRSPTIDEINESFRHHASKLHIFSFYETLSTAVGPVQVTILDKSSSVMGYPNETPQPLVANHHNVCKFTGVDDPNYTSVVGALRSVIASTTARLGRESAHLEDDLLRVRSMLGVSGPPEDDIAAARSVRKPGTCDAFLATPQAREWLTSRSPHLLWAHAPPGNGKSTTCSYVIDHLLESGHPCAYFFFRHEERNKRSVSYMLRSLAYQTALQVPSFRQALVERAKAGLQLHAADPAATVWKRLLLPALTASVVEIDGGVFWVVDAVDESESSKQFFEVVSSLGDLESPVRVLAFSRPLASIGQAFQLARRRMSAAQMPLPGNGDDIRRVVASEIEYLPSADDFKKQTIEKITSRAQGNFLWASLVLRRVVGCHRQDQVQQVLDATPDGMERLYDRMLDVVAGLETAEDQTLARVFLSWALHARTPLTVDELTEAYRAETRSIMDLRHTINQVCGEFVVLDPHGKITLVHHSARQYLTRATRLPFSLEPKRVHEELFGKCVVALCDRDLRGKIAALKLPRFLPYAATSWAYHLDSSAAVSDRILDALIRFFNGPHLLSWMQYLALSGHLSELCGVSRRLAAYVRRRRRCEADRPPMLHRLVDLAFLESWAVDLMKIPAKFGRHLSQDPALIFKAVPPLSPTTSAIHRKFGRGPSATVSVSRLSNTEWDDCLARVSAGPGRALRLAASSLYLAVVSDVPRGTVTVWDTNLFREHRTLNMGEHVWAIAFNESGSLLACYGIARTYVWTTESGAEKLVVPNPARERALDFRFRDDESLLMISDLRRVYRLQTGGRAASSQRSWRPLDPALLEETSVPEGPFLSTPSAVAFNPECTQIAVVYRSFPLSIWNVDPPELVARMKRKLKPGQGSVNSYTGDNRVVWHPAGREVVGIHGQVFRWNPTDDTYDEVKGAADSTGAVPHGIQCSPNGLVIITSDVAGTIKIYDYASLSLVYKLTSEDTINQLCFSPDSVRFYDLRGSYCNVWEPSCLLRMADAALERNADADSTTDSFWSDTDDTGSTSLSIAASESHVERKPAVRMMAAGDAPDAPLAYANDRGVLVIEEPLPGGPRLEIRPLAVPLPVESLAWDKHQKHLAYSLSNGTTTIKRVLIEGLPPHRQISVTDVYNERQSPADRGRPLQILFDPSGTLLLIHGAEKTQVLSLADARIVAESDATGGKSARWTLDPSGPDSILCLSGTAADVYNWQLEKLRSCGWDPSISVPISGDSSAPPATVDGVLQSHCAQFLLVRTISMHLNRPRYGFQILTTAALRPSSAAAAADGTDVPSDVAKPVSLSAEVQEAAEHPIGILPDGRFVFLDRDLWVCTVPLRNGAGEVTRHFFLPHDWVTNAGLRLCQVFRDGALLCPVKGEIALIDSEMCSDW